ncbi:hypothetical protein BG015_005682 [Linnemannia schmuckeri]|uniref:Uncharacterized protein n=1 Tax=Linnemannia schmuckeri TaxID=64567 RepID=A0A9P5VCG2_9FUNG|nr:hypothetical protein BG015_005682 [Linnemannia schmuckeri]
MSFRFPRIFEAWSEFFFACRSSPIQLFELGLRSNSGIEALESSSGEHESESGGTDSEDKLTMPRRQDPLPRLKVLQLPRFEDDTTAADIKEILDHYTNLTTLHFQDVTSAEIQSELTKIVVASCPFLKNVSFDGCASVAGPMFPCMLMSAFQEQQVEEFGWNSAKHPVRRPETSAMFWKHSKSLRTIVIGMYCRFESELLCSVLEACEGLEELSVQRGHIGALYDFMPVAFIKLGDHSVEHKPWACTRLRHLELSFGISLLPQSLGQEPYYNRRLARDGLSNEELQYFRVFEQLYRQIGSLT